VGALVEILAVELSEPPPSKLHGRYIDVPKAQSRVEANALDVTGWALGEASPATAVEFLDRGRVVWRVPVERERPDLTTAFPGYSWAGRAGFETTIRMTGATPEVALHLRALLADGSQVPLGTIRMRRGWRNAAPLEAALVSVVIPCHDQAHFLADAIESVLAQTYPHHEIVVVDDGSADNTEEIAASYPGVRCVRQPNAGLAAARNTGIRRSNGDYLVFLDADDRLLPEALRVGLDALRAHPECAFVSGHYRHIGVDGAPMSTPDLPCVFDDHYGALLRTNYVGMPATALYRREVFEHVTGFNPSLSPCADYDLNLRITRQFPVHCHEYTVAEYRRHGSNMTRDLPSMLASAMTVMRSQRPYVRQEMVRRSAYKAGVRFWQDYYGKPLAADVAAHLRAGEWGGAVTKLGALARHYPRGLSLALAALRR